jgi:tRNA 2-thiouridine synthesizing protein A
VLDARGWRCPVPVLRARERLSALNPGDTLELIADDPLITLDVPAFCAQEDHELLDCREEEGVWRLSIRRGR